jgi:hypothetical protein
MVPTGSLEKAYGQLLKAARARHFAEPAEPWQWGAQRILAHVAANDRLLAAAAAELLAGGHPEYDNALSVRVAYLDDLLRGAPTPAMLAAVVRAQGIELVALAERLGVGQAAVEVPARIYEGDDVIVEGRRPWGEILAVHEQHLVLHTEQLRALRRGRLSRA